MHLKKYLFLLITMASVILLFSEPGVSKIYQYKDENGVLRFTDSPPGDKTESFKQMEGMRESRHGLKDLRKTLYDLFEPAGEVHKASIATVTVMSSIGKGSGFFITDIGHILTNKHVIRGNKKQTERIDRIIEDVDSEVEMTEKSFEVREGRLKEYEDYVNKLKARLDKLPDGSSQKADLERKYQAEYEYYTTLKEDVERQKGRFEKGKEKYDEQRYEYNSRTAFAGVSRYFTITLKDGTELNAHLVSESNNHDLALLKVDGYLTPSLEPANISNVSQGEAVCAIGSPISLRDSVSKGVVSGFTRDFIKTDAKIYPGNSGGPLVTLDGKVVGINTLKQLTRNFEGLGFAIPIDTAYDEFGSELKR